MSTTLTATLTAMELVEKMLEWSKLKATLDELQGTIENAVLLLEETQNVGNVRVTYSGGRRSFNYKAAGENASEKIVADNTKTTTSTSIDWKQVCVDAEIAEEEATS